MASLVHGFEYDIFISYRQKDNRPSSDFGSHSRGGWVTEFVAALKSELDATFKDDVSIYFDENPHDGLLETHDVDDSLKDKLKCLIFIPIISQTYCDPKSFAWRNEFLAFKKLASEDQLGLKIKLQNGNVASRLLPLKIHDLDDNDKALVESEIGPMRSIDFIYKEQGVNRPLKSTDDKNDNHNKTDYRNQVNKVANALKEVISSLKNPITTTQVSSLKDQGDKRSLKGKFIVSSALLILLVAGYFFYPQLFSMKSSAEVEKSVAVLPFVNMSNDPEQEYFSDGLTEEVIDRLTKIKGLRVISRTSTMDYKNIKKRVPEIAKELGVAFILEGSVRKSDKGLRISVQLINGKTDEHVWSETLDKSIQEIFDMQREIATQLADYFKITLTSAASGALNKISTSSIAAYDYYLKARAKSMQRKLEIDEAISLYKKSISLDHQFAEAVGYLAYTYSQKAGNFQVNKWSDSALHYAKVAYGISPELAVPNFSMGFALWNTGRDSAALYYFRKASKLDLRYFRSMSAIMHNNGKIDSAYFFANLLTRQGDPYSRELGLIQKIVLFTSLQKFDSTNALIDKASRINVFNSYDRDLIRYSAISSLIISRSFESAIRYIDESYSNEKDPSLIEQRKDFLRTIYALQKDWKKVSELVTEQDRLWMALVHKKLNHRTELENLCKELSSTNSERPLTTFDDRDLSLLKDDFSKPIEYFRKMPLEKRAIRFIRWKANPYAEEFVNSIEFKQLFVGYDEWQTEMMKRIAEISRK